MPSERRNSGRQTFEPLDSISRRIVQELHGDARLRTAELARRVGLSPPAVAERLRRLEDSGALSYRAEVDPRALGYAISAIVRVSPTTRDLRVIPEIARVLPDHRRGLLLHAGPPALDRRPGTDPGPLHPARAHHHLDRPLGPRAPSTAAPRRARGDLTPAAGCCIQSPG